MLRTLAERLSRGRVFWRHLPAEAGGGRVLVTPDAALAYLKPGRAAFEPGLLEAARELVRPGDRVWDIGANVGVFAVAAASAAGPAGRVLCVEADTWLATLLLRTAAAQDAASAPIDVLAAAVSDRSGLAMFSIAERGRASNSLESAGGRTVAGGVRERRVVPTLALDQLVDEWGAPAVVKIDVEGAESMVLRGAERLLREVRPAIYCEVGKPCAEEVGSILEKAGYVRLDPLLPPAERRPLDRCPFNTLALPAESFRSSAGDGAVPATRRRSDEATK